MFFSHGTPIINQTTTVIQVYYLVIASEINATSLDKSDLH